MGRSLSAANLDFEARVPVPFSIFPSSYKEDTTPAPAVANSTFQTTHEAFSVQLPQHHHRPGREEGQQHASSSTSSYVVDEEESSYRRSDNRYPYRADEVRITREEERYRRPSARSDYRPVSQSTVDYDVRRQYYDSPIDVAEREYRSRYQPNFREEARPFAGTTVDGARYPQPQQQQSTYSVDDSTIDPAPLALPPASSYRRETIEEDIVERSTVSRPRSTKMGYYDEEGNYHSFRAGVHKFADRLLHPEAARESIEVNEYRESVRGGSDVGSRVSSSSHRSSSHGPATNTVSIPCHHIRIGDILMLQGRPCQVIRISTSSATGQHRYLGVDLFTKKLHEESSFVANPAPSVVVQTMLGPVFKQYRVLDLQEGHVVAMTETGDVKQGLPVLDQSSLWARLARAFESGRGSVRVLVVNDHGREMAVDMKVVHGASL
ncbi:Translation elongation factor IF5A [Niveomyces insectorum RCEF 264]|uniref:Translation elongation factor IF5A n=1 Tax=Niveomyces insectorum RCEF 264 TaxID=1081102 RepID=A0A167UJQ6_9HYPO|nr:Translation elongation factor IF5A [Niveomyces insectorum RCEF 264]